MYFHKIAIVYSGLLVNKRIFHCGFYVSMQVVGGMTWCITTCNFDIDVDLLFQENSTIGQKMCVSVVR